MSAVARRRCGGCCASLAPDDRYCEGCGAPAPAAVGGIDASSESCPGCGSCAPAGARGYCGECGTRRRAREELDLGAAAAVCDQGWVRERNEDAYALKLSGSDDGAFAAVVCDGLASAAGSGVAARRAADAAAGVLAGAMRARSSTLSAAIVAALDAAQCAVLAVPSDGHAELDPPSCTLVAAVGRAGMVAVGWAGDSRAYWLSQSGSRLLTRDDSWAQDQISAGRMDAAEAYADRRAHAITRWIGAGAPDAPPNVMTFSHSRGGRLVLCSDGAWGCAPQADDLAAIAGSQASAAALPVARALTGVALTAGGRDNITAVVVDLPQTGCRGVT